MKITNKYDLPDWITRKIRIYKPQEGKIYVTQLDSPRIRHLLMSRWDDLQCDYSAFLLSEDGNAIHSHYEDDAIQSELSMSLEMDGWVISGRADRYDEETGILGDIKNKAIGFDKFPSAITKTEKQLNTYAYILRQNGLSVNGLEMWVKYRDWKPMLAIMNKGKDYPKCLWHKIDIDLWSEEKQKDYIKKCLVSHTMSPMQMCDDDTRGHKDDTFAVMKKGRKSALVASWNGIPVNSRELAMEIIKEKNLTQEFKKGTIWIEERKGEDMLCKYFCSVRHVCPYAKDWAYK